MASTYFMSSVNGFVSSRRRLQRPSKSSASPKFRQMDFACPMCRKPFGSGGKRVVTGRPKRPVATSSSTSSRMKLLRGVVSLDTIQEAEAHLKYNRHPMRTLLPAVGLSVAACLGAGQEARGQSFQITPADWDQIA